MKNNKGQMRVIETIIASFIIIAALAFVSIFAASPESFGYEMKDLEKMGYSALHDLDQQGILRPLVYNDRWSDLRTILKITLQNDVYFNLTISDLPSGQIQSAPDAQILYGDSETFSDAKNIASLRYWLAGENKYEPKILTLQLTRG